MGMAVDATDADVAPIFGAGAATGFGIGALPNCSASKRRMNVEHVDTVASRRAHLAVELARRASTCCEQLPSSSTVVDRGWKHRTALWPAFISSLLALAADVSDHALRLCAEGTSAAILWASQEVRASCSEAEIASDESWASPASGLESLRGTVDALRALDREMRHSVQDALSIAKSSRRSFFEVAVTPLLGALAIGSPLLAFDEGQSAVETVEPALLVRYFCAGAAAMLLDQRTLQLVSHIGWLESSSAKPLQQDAVAPSDLPVLEVAADFLRPSGASAVRPRGVAPGRDLPLVPQSEALNEPLLVISLRHGTTYGRVWAMAEDVQQHFELAAAGTPGHSTSVRVVWMESISLRHLPRLGQIFRGNAKVEVLYRPLFSMHPGDYEAVLRHQPTLAQRLCARARRCWWFEVPLGPPPSAHLHSFMTPTLGQDAPPLPTSLGCWYWLPSGCHAVGGADESATMHRWHRDEVGERQFDALVDPHACLRVRRDLFNQWCNVEDAQMHYVADPKPESQAPHVDSTGSHAPLAEVLVALSEARSAEVSLPQGVREVLPTRMALAGSIGARVGSQKQTMEIGGEQSGGDDSLEGAPRAWHSYLRWHAREVVALRSASTTGDMAPAASLPGSSALRRLPGAVVWACHPSLPCGGHGDRLKGILAAFVLAITTGRLFFIDAPDPWDLRLFMEPALLDWRVVGLRGVAVGRHVLWDHDAFDSFYLDTLLEADEPLWVLYTNKRSIIGPMLRHSKLKAAAQRLGLLPRDDNSPALAHFAHLAWRVLFRPTEALERRWRSLQDSLGGPGARYIAMHHRAGDLVAGFGVVNGELDRRNGPEEVVGLLSCAHVLERRLGLPNTTRWFLATDSRTAVDVPQAQVWRRFGKLVVRDPETDRVHVATAGVVPPSGAKPSPAHDQALGDTHRSPRSRHNDDFVGGQNLLASAASLVGVADAWVDFLALMRSSAAVVSSSAFGMMAAQVGAHEHAYSAQGCIRLDLLT